MLDRIESVVGQPDALAPLVFGGCWLPSALSGDMQIELMAGESLRAAVVRLGHGWNPDWLFDEKAGWEVADAAGVRLRSSIAIASAPGPVQCSPAIRLPRVDDQISDGVNRSGQAFRKRLAGEVLVAVLWRRAALRSGVADVIPEPEITPQKTGG